MKATLRRLNCWQYNNCGREQGGVMAPLLGVCPVASSMKHDGLNGGVAAGRACWLIPNSGCRETNSTESPRRSCHECKFYIRVMSEEKEDLKGALHSVPA
jgi:hypothetical protein